MFDRKAFPENDKIKIWICFRAKSYAALTLVCFDEQNNIKVEK